MKFNWLKAAFAGTALFVSSCINVANAGLIIESGELIGATKVNVNGELYDVSFQDGSCSSLFDGCDELSDLFWQTASEAVEASQALLDYVLLDSALGEFDSTPTLTRGCERRDLCQISTPWGFKNSTSVQVAWVDNYNRVDGDIARTVESWAGWSRTQDFTSFVNRTYAVWSKSVVASPSLLPINIPQDPIQVSEPTTVALFGLAMLGLVSRRRAA